MRVKLLFVSEDLEDGESADLSAHEAACLCLTTFAGLAASDALVKANASGLTGDLAGLYLTAWRTTVETQLLEAMALAGVPGAAELKAARLPQVESLEAVRDDSGRITHTIKRLVADPRSLEP